MTIEEMTAFIMRAINAEDDLGNSAGYEVTALNPTLFTVKAEGSSFIVLVQPWGSTSNE